MKSLCNQQSNNMTSQKTQLDIGLIFHFSIPFPRCVWCNEQVVRVFPSECLTGVFQEDSQQVTVSVQDGGQQQPGTASWVRGQQPQLALGGRFARQALPSTETVTGQTDRRNNTQQQ